MRTRLACSFAVVLGLVGLACSEPRDPGGAFLALELRLPAGAVNITAVTVIVRDHNASCNGADAQGGAELVRQDVVIGTAARLEVSPGERTVSAIAMDGTTPVARGCQEVIVTSGEATAVMIQLVEYPGLPDGGVDGPMIDGPDGGGTEGDDCDNPGTVATGGGTITRSMTGATDSVTPSCGTSGAADVFYQFSLAQPSEVDFRLADSGGGDHAIAVYSGDCGTLVERACATGSDPDVLTDVPLAAGTYYVVIEEETVGSAASFALTVTAVTVPILEDCANPGTVTLGGGAVAGNYSGAADDTSGSCGGGGQRDQVYLLDVPDRQYVRVTTAGCANCALYVRDTCNVMSSEVGTPLCDSTDPRQIDLGLAQGDYYVWIDRTGSGGSQAYTVTATTLAPPNDACPGSALAPGTVNGTLLGANNTAPPPSCGGAGNDVFYTFTTVADQRLTATVTAANAATDPTVSLRSTCTDAATELGCADDMTGATETLDIPVLPAGTYFLVVDSNGAASSFSLSLTLAAPTAANDTCASPIAITEPGPTGESIALATDDENGTCGGAGTDVVYSFTATAGQDLALTVTPTNFDAAVYVRAGSCTAGTEVACASGVGVGSAVTVNAPALGAGTHYIIVEKKSGAGTLFDLSLSLTP